MDKIIITNNSKVYNKFNSKFNVIYLENRSYTDVLYTIRDLLHGGYILLTHPMAGSLKPNQTPYKTVIAIKSEGITDYESVMLIENSIDAAFKFLKFKKTPEWNMETLDDFKTVDLSLIENIVKNHVF